MKTELPPVAVCTKCGHFSYSAGQIGEQCGLFPDGKRRCKGNYGSALNNDDWDKCGACDGTGMDSEGSCRACQSTGWRFVRDRPRR